MGHSGRVWPRVWSACSQHQGADRDVEGGVGGAQCRGENIRRSQVSARDEPKDLPLSRAVTRLSSCACPRVASLTAQQVAWDAPVSREPLWQAAQGTCSQGPAKPKRKRTELTNSSGSITAVMRVPTPHPRMVHVAREPRRSPPAHASEAGLNARSCPRKR